MALGLITTLAAMAVSSDPADARSRHKRYKKTHHARVSSYDPPGASIVVDVNSGKVLQASNPDALRHPASLTKIMTLYLLFERLEAGQLKLNSEMRVSEHASRQAPTKLGLRPGQTLEVEDAIKGLVTRSANDAAVVIAETIGGDEPGFARIMTQKARALGMKNTTYKNASGLPNDDQVTTARDQAILGRAIQDRFPRYYKYFATTSFTWRGRAIRNHNRLLGRVEGVDGIKTGYTRASGFNLVTSIRRDRRHVVAVVLGGSSAARRDARMRDLISEYIQVAATTRTTVKVAEAPEAKAQPITLASATPNWPTTAPAEPPARAPQPAPIIHGAPPPGSTDPIKPVRVRTVSVKPAAIKTASLAPVAAPAAPVASDIERTASVPPGHRPGVLGVLPAAAVTRAEPAEPVEPARPVLAQTEPARAAPVRHEAVKVEAKIEPKIETKIEIKPEHKVAHSGWIIQVGAFTQESEAKERLSQVHERAKKLLAAADPFTETFVKGDTKYYRARFAGLEKDQAEAACKYLKRNDVACLTIRN